VTQVGRNGAIPTGPALESVEGTRRCFRVSQGVRYLIPPGIPDEDLPLEVRIGLRLAARIAARIAREQALKALASVPEEPDVIK
jgi:hypothetical protein